MELLVAIGSNVVLGLLLLVLFARWRRPPAPLSVGDTDEVLQHYRLHYPESNGTVVAGADGDAAFVALQAGGLGLLQRHGRRWNARQLTPGEVRSVLEEGDVLKVRLNDFGWPSCRIRVTDSNVRAALLAQLRGLAPRDTAVRSMAGPHA